MNSSSQTIELSADQNTRKKLYLSRCIFIKLDCTLKMPTMFLSMRAPERMISDRDSNPREEGVESALTH